MQAYGYGFLFLGTLLEGELVLLAAGFLAYLGLMNFWLALIVGFCGAIAGDNLWFWMGRKSGQQFIEKFGRYFFLTARRLKKARIYFENHGSKTIFISRFIFGTRISSAVLAGALGMDWKNFAKSNLVGAVVWTIVTLAIGYLFGHSFEFLLKIFRRAEIALLILAGAAIIILIFRFLMNFGEV